MSSSVVLSIGRIGFHWETANPFLFCAHHHDAFPRGNAAQGPAVPLLGRDLGSDFSGQDGFSMYHGETVPGFPVHPHRGFETVTIVLEGIVDHFDSKGADGRYGDGDVQWFTTGSGCQHAEMFPLVHQDRDNPLELFQVWLNLPTASKFAEPAYKMLWSEDIPVVEVPGPGGAKSFVRVVAGKFGDAVGLEPCPDSWAHDPANNVGILLIRMDPGAVLTLPAVSSTLSRNLYFHQGKDAIQIGGHVTAPSSRVGLRGDAAIEIVNGPSESRLLLLEGEPIREPVAKYGPFVMNTESEIREAIADYRRTQFGGWPWDRTDPVHDRSEGRFARHPDGTIERR